MSRRPVVGVMGGSQVDAEVEDLARHTGAAIAREGWILLNGGRDEGVMAASAAGAHDAGGFVVGILPGRRGEEPVAAGLDLAIFSGIGFARNAMNILTSDVIIVLPGATGTLSEAAYAVTYGCPAILLRFDDGGVLGAAVHRVDTVAEAMEAVRMLLATPDAT